MRRRTFQPAADTADDAAEVVAPYGFRSNMRFLPWRFWFVFHQRLGDAAPTALDCGRLICHAALAKPLAVLALAVAVIPPNLGILLIAPVRFLPLLPPRFSPAFITAVHLTSIAGPADEKHLPTVDRTAE